MYRAHIKVAFTHYSPFLCLWSGCKETLISNYEVQTRSVSTGAPLLGNCLTPCDSDKKKNLPIGTYIKKRVTINMLFQLF
jgi:hypothetical protein